MVTRSRLKRSGSKAKKATRLKRRYDYYIGTVPNAYGFGRDYTLYVNDLKTGKLRSFWMGQDAKVFSRTLGMDMDFAVDYYSKKAGSKDFNIVQKFIAEDILKSVINKSADDELTDEDIEKIVSGAEDWSFAVQ